jgi:hypothetical protein
LRANSNVVLKRVEPRVPKVERIATEKRVAISAYLTIVVPD